MKLLAKNAEERYQTAPGLEADLRRCLAEWQSTGRIDPFPLGAHDASDRLLIPEKLYGREREIDALLAAFDRVVANGTSELVLVSGYSGVGKSSMVNELHKVLVRPRGLFVDDRRLHVRATERLGGKQAGEPGAHDRDTMPMRRRGSAIDWRLVIYDRHADLDLRRTARRCATATEGVAACDIQNQHWQLACPDVIGRTSPECAFFAIESVSARVHFACEHARTH